MAINISKESKKTIPGFRKQHLPISCYLYVMSMHVVSLPSLANSDLGIRRPLPRIVEVHLPKIAALSQGPLFGCASPHCPASIGQTHAMFCGISTAGVKSGRLLILDDLRCSLFIPSKLPKRASVRYAEFNTLRV